MKIQKAYSIALRKAQKFTGWGGGYISKQLELGDVYYFSLSFYSPPHSPIAGGCFGFYVNKKTGKLKALGGKAAFCEFAAKTKKYQSEYYNIIKNITYKPTKPINFKAFANYWANFLIRKLLNSKHDIIIL
jgi:hypothetical protein